MRGLSAVWGWASWVVLGCTEALPGAPDPAARDLVLLHTTDLHSRVWPFLERISSFESQLGLGRAGALEEVAGFARLASLVEHERQKGARLWLDSGDALEGAEVFQRFQGQLELELLGALGLSAMALGNHELSLRAPALSAALGRGGFPVLAANLTPLPSSALAAHLVPSALFEVEGVKVGVIGVANPVSPPDLVQAASAWGLELVAEPAVAVQAALDDLLPRAELLVALSHLGLEDDRELVRNTSGLDLVLGGHQHVVTAEPEWQDDCTGALEQQRRCRSRRVPIVHSGAYGKLVSRVSLTLARATSARDDWEVKGLRLEQLPLAASVPERADIAQRLAALQGPTAAVGFVPEAIARRSPLAGDSPLGNLTVDALRDATGAEVVLLNSSGLRGDLEPGLLLTTDLALAFPFAEPWHWVWAFGRELRSGLESAARRSASRRCESALQVAGLRLRVSCSVCLRGERCLEVWRRTPWGEEPLLDDELLGVLLPRYLTRAGADFAGLGSGGASELGLSLPEALGRQLSHLTAGPSSRACEAALSSLSADRCQRVFGAISCPLQVAQARAHCERLPRIEGTRDERIQMLP
jgi:5'-nucleotidase / UDP-sugar diphosphatase